MEQRISLITLGVKDVTRARLFYEQLGWRGQELEDTVFFQARGQAVVLWDRDKLATDSGVVPDHVWEIACNPGFPLDDAGDLAVPDFNDTA